MRTKLFFLLFIASGILLGAGIWTYSSMVESVTTTDILMFGVLIIVVAFAIFIGLSRLQSEKRGQPSEDEMSKLIVQKTAATSYYVSLYLWIALLFFYGHRNSETETAIGVGVVGMSVIFALSWFYHRVRGLKS